MKDYRIVRFMLFFLMPSTGAHAINFESILLYRLGENDYRQSQTDILVTEIDEKIGIEWNEADLSTQLGIERGLIAKGESLLQRIDFLRKVTSHFFTANVYLQELKAADAQLQVERSEKKALNKISELEGTRDAASDKFSREALAGIELVKEGSKNLDLLQDKTLSISLYDALNDAVFVGYEEIAKVTGRFLAVEMDRLKEELSKRTKEGESINVYMSAQIHSAGTLRALHLEGYDDITVGLPVPFARFQIAVAERTKRELEAAESLGSLIKDGNKLLKEVEAAVRAVRDQISALGKAMKIEALDGNLRNLEQSLLESADTTVGPLIEKVKEARNRIQLLTKAPEFSATGDAAILIEIAGQLQTTVWDLRFVAQSAAREITSLVDELEQRIQALPSAISSQSLTMLRSFSESLKNDSEVAQVFKRMDEIVTALGLSNQVATSVLETSKAGRIALADEPLDTWLDLLTAGERHPGDMILIYAKVTSKHENEKEITISETRQRIQLRVVGFYVETRGALFFVDPRGGGFVGQNFEPAVSLSYMGHVGSRHGTFWNSWLNPGLGVSLTLLDFEVNHDIELGLSASLTVLNDFLYVGYGRNLQVKTDFFYFGINPLVFSELLGQRRSSR